MTSISIFINAVFLSFILGHISVKANAISAIIWRHQIEGGGKLGKRGLRNGNGGECKRKKWRKDVENIGII